MLGLEFPPINEVINWKDLFPSFNTIALITVLAAIVGIAIFLIAANRNPMKAPTGVRNVAEVGVEFIEDQIVMQTMGREGLPWTPFLLTLFEGRQSARTVHFVITNLLVLFVVVHVALVLLSGFWNNMRGMLTGWFVIERKVEPAEPPEGERT